MSGLEVVCAGGPCSGHRYTWRGGPVLTGYVDFSIPSLPVLKQVRYDVLPDERIAVYAGECDAQGESDTTH